MSGFLRAFSTSFVALLAGCTGVYDERNAFLTYTDSFGAFSTSDDDDDSQAGGSSADTSFRRTMRLELTNTNPDADVSVYVAAWVNVSSIRSAEQQDDLFAGGFVQLPAEVRLGTFVLPPGTFVRNGPGLAGAERVQIPGGESRAIVRERFRDPGDLDTNDDGTLDEGIITPDAILVFHSPPTSCEDVGFQFIRDGRPISEVPVEGSDGLIFGGSNSTGGVKALSAYSAYQCQPFRPGLFFKAGGGVSNENEYFEGQDVNIDFNVDPDPDGKFAIVTIGG